MMKLLGWGNKSKTFDEGRMNDNFKGLPKHEALPRISSSAHTCIVTVTKGVMLFHPTM